MELWDLHNEDRTLSGYDLVRGEEIPKGLFHIISEVIVKQKDGEYLICSETIKNQHAQDYMKLEQVVL